MKMSIVKYIIAISTGIFLRSTISLHSYSGENNPPMYGDFEAQRHWQEVTVNLPIKDWYENSTDNDLLYWGLDYPPLTAYHSFIIGHFAKYINESYVALHTSRGITTDDHKFFMRNSVLMSDILIYIPAMLLTCHVIFSKLLKMNKEKSESFYWLFVLIALCYPGQLLIDNGHFQYNNMSLGLAALAISAILLDKRIIGAILFVLSLNYKQMELYHAVPFFCYLLSNSFVESDSHRRHSFVGSVVRLFKLGIIVAITFVIIWTPWLFSMSSFLQVLHRIFPIYRGVFEDKVSNVWCIVNVFMKIKDNFTNEEMAKICLGCTATALVPSAVNLLFNPKKKQFLYALINSSLAFFLFSFQVHEKSILIVAIPVILIFPLEPFISFWFLQVSTFSMIPLLVKDGLITAYIGLSGMFFLMTKIIIDNTRSKKQENLNFLQILWNINFNKSRKWIEILFTGCYVLSTIVQLGLFLGNFYISPPEHLPFLHSLLISAFSCCHFLFFLFYFNIKQLLLN